MNNREISEIKRRFKPEKNNIGRICGCYVNNNTIISDFNMNFNLISTDEAEELLAILRKVFSGSISRNLIDISFSNQQVLDSDEHKILSNLRESTLSDETVVKSFFDKIVSNIIIDGSYIILLANDKYDVFTYNNDGEKNESNEIFSYIVCAVCPVKAAKPALSYTLSENKFKNLVRDSLICPPEFGFMFPAFDDRHTNIYNTLFYTKNASDSHKDFTDVVFKTELPLPATEQTAAIASMFNTSVSEDCDMEFVQSVQSQLIELTSDHKANKIPEPLTLSNKDINSLLRCGGVSEDVVNDFSEKFNANLGSNAAIAPENIMNIKKFEVKTPDVTVRVSAEKSNLLETRIIDGTKYILIRADDAVEVNGILININE